MTSFPETRDIEDCVSASKAYSVYKGEGHPPEWKYGIIMTSNSGAFCFVLSKTGKSLFSLYVSKFQEDVIKWG